MSEWLAWAWVIGVDLAVVVGAVFASYDRTPLTALRPQHVAAATIVGVMAWEGATNVIAALVSAVGPFTALDIAFLAAQTIFAAAAAVMIVFVLRRRRWAVVLGIGLALSRFLLAILAVIEMLLASAGVEGGGIAGTAVFVSLGALPLLAAVWLFLDPFFRGQLAWSPAEPIATEAADSTESAEAALER